MVSGASSPAPLLYTRNAPPSLLELGSRLTPISSSLSTDQIVLLIPITSSISQSYMSIRGCSRLIGFGGNFYPSIQSLPAAQFYRIC